MFLGELRVKRWDSLRGSCQLVFMDVLEYEESRYVGVYTTLITPLV